MTFVAANFNSINMNLSGFCRRVGIATNAGLPLVSSIKREAAGNRNSRLWADVAASIEDGNSLAESLRPHQKKLTEMFVALVEVGEESGRLGETLLELADYYDRMNDIRRDFLKSLVWPIIELVAAVVVIGLMILICGWLTEMTGTKIDPLGLGLIGVKGLAVYLVFLGAVVGIGCALYQFMKQSVERSRAVHYFLLRIPKLGALLKTLALTRLTWGLHLTFRTGMDVRRALTLSFRAVGFAPISDNLPAMLQTIDGGGNLTDAFLAANHLDGDLISCVDSGEQAGTLPELMTKLSTQYFQQSLLNLKVLSVFGGFAVYGCIAIVIILVIFRLASFYVGILNDAAGMTF